MLKQMPLETFADAVASLEPVPGGGSAAALAGGLAAALAAMVAGLTRRNERYADRALEMQRLGDTASELQKELLNAVDRDAQSYRLVLAAFRLPKSTEKERQKRAETIQAAFKHATEVPMQVAEAALQVLELAATAARHGNPDMRTDAGVGVLLARAAALGALMNARINLTSMKDKEFTANVEQRIAKLKQDVIRMESSALDSMKP
jgi:methenyltetrahydrofolate cyclohydrolase